MPRSHPIPFISVLALSKLINKRRPSSTWLSLFNERVHWKWGIRMIKPAVVIVHGAWHVPLHYSAFPKQVKTQGYDVHTPHLPSRGELVAQSKLAGDVRVIHQQIRSLDDASCQVIVVAHSYGGAATTQALEGDLPSSRDRAKNGF